MRARYIKQDILRSLRSSISANLDCYRKGSFSHLAGDPANFFEGSFDYDEDALAALVIPTTAGDFEAENCALCFDSLMAMSPYEARDERFWTYITHTCLLKYTRARWPIPADDATAIPYIETHFFASTKRAIERDNAASRLWWMAHLCHRVHGVSLQDSLRVLHFRTDVRANIIERPTVSQNTQIFGALLKTLKRSLETDQILFDRDRFRTMMIDLNSAGGATLLDAMSEVQISSILRDIINTVGAPGWKAKKASSSATVTASRQPSVSGTGSTKPARKSTFRASKAAKAKAAKLKAAKDRAKEKSKLAKRISPAVKGNASSKASEKRLGTTIKAVASTPSQAPSKAPASKVKAKTTRKATAKPKQKRRLK